MKLNEATSSLASKVEAATELEGQVVTLKTSLDAALAEVEGKQSAVDELEAAKAQAEKELAELKQSLNDFQAGRGDDESALNALREQVRSLHC